MRLTILLAALLTLALTSVAQAGRLDIAVFEYSDARDLDALAAALTNADLPAISDSERIATSEKAITGGYVLFAQSFGVAPGSKFGTSTRIKNLRADVSGSLSGTTLAIQIGLREETKVGLSKSRDRSFAGTGSVAGGVPRIVAVKQSKGKMESVTRNRSVTVNYNLTTVVIACYRP